METGWRNAAESPDEVLIKEETDLSGTARPVEIELAASLAGEGRA